jgi:PPOX class probable F420-dependent enzyme
MRGSALVVAAHARAFDGGLLRTPDTLAMTTATPTCTGPTAGPVTPEMLERLAAEDVIWLSTIRPDGRPHIVPVWFTWDGEAITFFSKPHAQKVRNLAANPNVMLAIGVPDEEMDVELIEGCAEVIDAPATDVASGRLEKYRALMARLGLSVEQFFQTYSQVVRIRPTRFLGWGGPGWVTGTTAAAG